jgi:hypothetical protein
MSQQTFVEYCQERAGRIPDDLELDVRLQLNSQYEARQAQAAGGVQGQAHIYPPQPPQPLPSIDLEEWRGEAAVACTVVTVSILKAPHNVRHRFAKGLIALGKKSGRQYSGFVKRESSTIVSAQIVTTNTASAHDLGALWGFLRNNWPSVDKAAILYKNNDFEHVASLSDHFMVLQPNGEPDNWSNQAVDFDDGASDYSVVSSIN